MSFSFIFFLPRKLLLLGLLAMICPLAQAQPGANSQWYFGRFGAMDFRSGRPTPLALSTMDASEGCASISDSVGNLLFYTDGITVWNRFHQPMRGGSELQPGQETATQAAVIVPEPGNHFRYYLFLTDAQAGQINTDGCGCLSWAIIDMRLDNGRGGVVDIGSRLGLITEKLAAVTHANGRDYWILTHKWGTADFLAYRLYPDSVSRRPVVTRIGSSHTTVQVPIFEPAVDAVGEMTFSPDGRRVAVAVYASSFAEVFDFNRRTGRLSNPAKLPLPIAGSDGSAGCYGVAFSATGQRLYVSRYLMNQRTDLTQYDLRVPRGRVAGTAIRLAGIGVGIELAPNGKIYGIHPLDPALNSVESPDAPGPLCTVRKWSAPLTQPASGRLGLPNSAVFLEALPDVPPTADVIPLPNIITPNGDGYNDAFTPNEYPESLIGELRIFSRWGKLVFSTNDLVTGWPGEAAAAGTYFYELHYRLLDDNPADEPRRTRGWVELVR
jgi:gliding motility-associated-like protein